MELIIHFDKIKDPSEKPQTIAEYNRDLEEGSAEIRNGKFTTAEDLLLESRTW